MGKEELAVWKHNALLSERTFHLRPPWPQQELAFMESLSVGEARPLPCAFRSFMEKIPVSSLNSGHVHSGAFGGA